MIIETLEQAVSHIYQIVKQREGRGARKSSPFFFIVGAGISHPPIPLAFEIEAECRKEAEKYGNTASSHATDALGTYSHWFSQAFPGAAEQQQYLYDLMADKPISKANLRLAHLVLDGAIARTVFTTNFDDLLTKALALFGQRPNVCDHPLTVTRMTTDTNLAQIVHVHGSYSFYDCCNLVHDIADRSQNYLMSLKLDEFLQSHSPLVIGYSGWERDIIMSALKRRLASGRLGTPLYWFCYKKADYDSLPPWIKTSNDVRIVLPDALDSNPATPATTVPSEASTKATAGDSLFDTSGKDATLPADRVFDAMIRQFRMPSPPLTTDPLAFFSAQLRQLLGTSDSREDEPEIYGFPTVIRRMEQARDAQLRIAPDALESFRDALRRADYRAAIRLAFQWEVSNLSVAEMKELSAAVLDACTSLDDNSSDEIAGYDYVIDLVDHLEAAGEANHKIEAARALLLKGVSLASLKRSEEAIEAYDQIVERYSDVHDSMLQEQVAKALINKGLRLSATGRTEEEIAVYDEVIKKYSGYTDPGAIRLWRQVSRAQWFKGITLGGMKRHHEAIAVFDDLLARFEDSSDSAIQRNVATALFNKASQLDAIGSPEGAIRTYDDLLRRFENSSDSQIQERVARTFLAKGQDLFRTEKYEEAIALYDQMLRRFGNSQETALQTHVAEALWSKGTSLAVVGRDGDAIDTYDDLLLRFADSSEPGLQRLVVETLESKANLLATTGRNADALFHYDALLDRIENAADPTLEEMEAKALLDKGGLLDNLNEIQGGAASYRLIVSRFAGSPKPSIQEAVAEARRRLDSLGGSSA